MDAAADVTAACLLMEGLARIAREQLLSLAQGGGRALRTLKAE